MMQEEDGKRGEGEKVREKFRKSEGERIGLEPLRSKVRGND